MRKPYPRRPPIRRFCPEETPSGDREVNTMDGIGRMNENWAWEWALGIGRSNWAFDEDISEAPTPVPINNNDEQQIDNESQQESLDNKSLKDSYNFIYVTFVLLGISTLLPWKLVVAIKRFWDYKLQNPNALNITNGDNYCLKTGNQTELQEDFYVYLSIGINLTLFILIE